MSRLMCFCTKGVSRIPNAQAADHCRWISKTKTILKYSGSRKFVTSDIPLDLTFAENYSSLTNRQDGRKVSLFLVFYPLSWFRKLRLFLSLGALEWEIYTEGSFRKTGHRLKTVQHDLYAPEERGFICIR